MRPGIAACHAAWWASCLPGWARFRLAVHRPMAVQRQILTGYLRSNADTAFGRRYRFERIRSADAYRDAVPLTTFEEYVPYVERIAAGEQGVLTREPVRVLEPTSGSASAAKWIPYTGTLRREFARGLAPWVASLFNADPALAGGPAYWSITPPESVDSPHTAAVPVGFEEDTAYLGGPLRRLIGATLAVPSHARLISDIESFRYFTALMLLRARELRLVSVWHPSYLELLLDSIFQNWDALLSDIRNGSLRPPGAVDSGLVARLERDLRPAPRCAAELERAGRRPAGKLWPKLRLVSCWADGHASSAASQLAREFPGVRVQPKGLLATEAFVTLPWSDGNALAVRSHFFEFLTERGGSLLAHQLEPGGTYSVVVTTGGGLYRYRLDDRVRVTGFVGATPMLCFLGKEDHVSDQCGEKLHAAFVAEALRRVLGDRSTKFAMVAPDTVGPRPGYTLYVEGANGESFGDVASLLEVALHENPHYRNCVKLEQLRAARVFRIAGSAFDIYARRCMKEGRRLGDLKPEPLSTQTGWSDWFDGTYEEATRGARP